MDEQRLEEIAEKAAKRIMGEAVPHIVAAHDHFDTCVAEAIVESAIHEALSSQEEELRETREALAAVSEDYRNNFTALQQAEEELRSLREERDALHAQLSGVGIVPYLDRMKELAEARDEALALMKRDQSDMYRALLADQAKQDELRVRAESAEAGWEKCHAEIGQLNAELLRLREGMKAVYNTFVRDEAQGYRSRDRQYAIEVLGTLLEPLPAQSATE
jgi:hypothetical protein